MTAVKHPDVSIIIPAYNSGSTIVRSLFSTHNQGVFAEIIIIDDCSSDNTIDVIENKLMPLYDNIQLIKSPKNLGASGARNLGIKAAKAKYIAFLDADDVWLPNKLIRQKAIMDNNSDCVIVSCDSLKVSPQGNVLLRAHEKKPPKEGVEAWKTLLSYNFMPTPTIFTRRELVLQVGGFNEALAVGEDLDLWIKIAKLGEIHILNDIYVHYFDYTNSLMKRGGPESATYIMEMIEEHALDERLTMSEKKEILARRYLELALQNLSFSQIPEMEYYFEQSIKMGFSKQVINNIRWKHKIKKLLNWKKINA